MAGIVDDVSVREPQRRQSGRGVRLIAPAVVALLRRRAVVAQTVGLDDESELGPVEVDAESR